MQTKIREDSITDSAFVSAKYRPKTEKDKYKAQVREKSEHLKKKSRTRKLEKEEKLTESEEAFFQTVKKVKKNLSSRKVENMH